MSQTETVTSTLRHISKLQGIERQALQAGDEESLLVARMMRGEITRLRAELLGAFPPPIRDVGAVESVTPGRPDARPASNEAGGRVGPAFPQVC